MTGSRGKHLNLLMATSPTTGVLYHEVVIGGVNGEHFGQFLAKVVRSDWSGI